MSSTNGQAQDHAAAPCAPSGDRSNGPAADHGTGGRFVKGNTAARRRAVPFSRDLSRVRVALFRALTDERMEEVVGALVRMVVEDHDIQAAEFLFRHCIGPGLTFNVNPDDVDLLELEKLRSQGQLDALGNSRLPPGVALVIEQVYQTMAAAEKISEDLDDGGTGLGQRLLAELRQAGLPQLARLAQQYHEQLPKEGAP